MRGVRCEQPHWTPPADFFLTGAIFSRWAAHSRSAAMSRPSGLHSDLSITEGATAGALAALGGGCESTLADAPVPWPGAFISG
jgi:hypothetical protein